MIRLLRLFRLLAATPTLDGLPADVFAHDM